MNSSESPRTHGSCAGRGAHRRLASFVAALLASPGLGILAPTLRHADVANEVISELPHLPGNIIHNAHTAVLMREHGIKQVCTRDTDFHQFAFLEVIDPLRA